ncbi:DUF4034 domain-containing protein [Chitinimonas lacunae]|uniref:DUF4034 domain-containing protein n=1 Tax=Chitinimonas lacunae TaxID=1963018 RepID=A0ABV8MKK3_9NEIS
MIDHPNHASISALRAQQAQWRLWLSQQDFQALDHYLDEQEALWLQGEENQRGRYGWAMDTLFDPLQTPDFASRRAQLERWAAARPDSYHAQVQLGRLWIGAAGEIRGTGTADEVDLTQWIGAQMACDRAFTHLLRAIECHPRPAFACNELFTVSSYLDEPEWLLDLYQGEPASPYVMPQDPEARAIWQAGLDHLQPYGAGLPEPLRSLPACLPPRAPDEIENGRLYWFGLAMHFHPRNLDALRIAVYYLYPRWYGDHSQMSAFIKGPLCSTLSETERGVLWETKAQDILCFTPDLQDEHAVGRHLDLWQALLQRPMPASLRHRCLGRYATLLCSVGHQEAAYRLYGEAAALEQSGAVEEYFGSKSMRWLAHLVIIEGLPDPERLLPRLMNQALCWQEDPWHLMLAALAYQYGLWGFPHQPGQQAAWLDRAAALIPFEKEERGIYRALCWLWKSQQFEAVEWLALQLAQRGTAQAMAFLADIQRNLLRPDTPKARRNPQQAQHWLREGADRGESECAIDLSLDFLWTGNPGKGQEALMQEAQQRLLAVFKTSDDAQRLALVSRLAKSNISSQESWAHDKLVPSLLAVDEAEIRLTLARLLANMYEYGQGGPQSSVLAKAWLTHALEIEQDDEAAQAMLRANQSNSPLTWLCRKLDNRASSLEELRQHLQAGRAYAPEGFVV